jgi:hypothetical protein
MNTFFKYLASKTTWTGIGTIGTAIGTAAAAGTLSFATVVPAVIAGLGLIFAQDTQK